MKAAPAAAEKMDHEDDAEDQGDALCRACARARTTVVPALGAALDHPLAQLLTGLLTVFALFGDDVHRSVYNGRVDGVAPDEEFSRLERGSAPMPSTRRDTTRDTQVRILAFDGASNADYIFSVTNAVVMTYFALEIVANCTVHYEDYFFGVYYIPVLCAGFYFFGGFYFWLDVISTASMIFDVHWLDVLDESGQAGLARSARMSRATKGARVVRLARLLRLVRVVKLFRLRARRVEDDDDDDVEQQPSKVAKRLTELATRKIVILLLLMVAVFPLFDDPLGATGASSDGSYRRLGVQTLHALRPTLPEDTTASDYCLSEMDAFCSNLRTYVSKMGKVRYLRVDGHDYDAYLKSIYFHRQGKGWFQGVKSTYSKSGGPRGKDSLGFPVHEGRGRMESDKRPLGKKRKACSIAPCSNEGAWDPREDLVDSLHELKELYGWRIGEGKDLDWSVVQEGDCVHPRECIQTGTVVFYDTRDAAKFDALLNLIRMIVVMVVLTTAVVVYTQDATVLVVGPIERMMSLVRRLAENPLGNMSQRKRNSQKNIDQTDETFLLDQTLTKISGLLQVGFGAAGAEVIARSMDTSLQNQTYVLPGKRVTAVFGFAIVEDFTVTCGALEEDTITYVNTVASIVHAGAAAFHGAPNKNIGCAFLLVWKICDGTLPGLRDLRDKDPPPNTPEFRQWRTARRAATSVASRAQDDIASRPVPPLEMVESALAAFLKVQVDLRAANAPGGRLAHFCNDPRVKKALGADFKVKMGFGLHVGWAIEGTIGSKFKIDASYLSPNVNVSARLEAATHMYDCPLLFSGFFADELSPAARSFCRMVDVVSVKGSNVPLELWTFDISTYPPSSPAPFTTVLNGHKVPKAVDFASDMYYRDLQRDISPEFMSRFNDGVQDYVAGDWLSSKKNLSEALKIMPADGPTKTLYRVLKSYDFRAPADWRGYRALTSKT